MAHGAKENLKEMATYKASKNSEFWRDYMGETPSEYFNKESKPKRGEPTGSAITKPGNKFSCWFCDVMHAVAQMTPTQCQTALRKKRPQKTSEF